MRASISKLIQILNRKERLQLLLLLLLITITAFSQTLGVASVMPFIGLIMEPATIFENEYLRWAYETFNFADTSSFIIVTGLVMLSLIIFSNAISALTTWQKTKFSLMHNHRLSMRLLKKYLSMPYAYFLNQNSADLSKNVLGEVNHLTQSYIIPFLQLLTNSFVVTFLLVMLLLIEPAVSMLAIALIGGPYAAIYFSLRKKLRQRGLLRFEANKKKFKAVSEAFGGIKEIKTMQVEPFFLNNYRGASLELTGHALWNAVVGQLPRYALEGIGFGGIIIFVLILFVTREDARQVIPLATLFAFAGYRIMPAIQEIFASFSGIQFHEAVLDRIHKDITTPGPAETNTSSGKTDKSGPLPFKNQIELRKLSYRYPGSREKALDNINLTIKRNTAVGFAGPTGAGKTTLVDIILGLLLPQEGQMLIDGVPVDENNRFSWQKNLGYVPQFIYLSDDTVARNIAFGRSDQDIDQEALFRSARIANIHDFIINELPAGYDTLVGERGIRLSGGQRQRIGIARALYHNPEVLVFDEATSALDGVTEETVLAAMESAARLKTLIIIAHRLSTVETCDLVYLIDRGRIVDQGTFNELIERNEQFRSMARAKA